MRTRKRLSGLAVTIVAVVFALSAMVGCGSKGTIRFAKVRTGQAEIVNEGREVVFRETGLRLSITDKTVIKSGIGHPSPAKKTTFELAIVNEGKIPLRFDSMSFLLTGWLDEDRQDVEFRIPAELYRPEPRKEQEVTLSPGQSELVRFEGYIQAVYLLVTYRVGDEAIKGIIRLYYRY